MSELGIPIKRHETLTELSRDHHHGLMLSWKIRKGQGLKIDAERIRAYCTFFYKNYLFAHFIEEEKLLFPVLHTNHPMVKKALQQHRRLERLFLEEKDSNKAITLIEEELEQHIRFEERVLFNEIQNAMSDAKLYALSEKLKHGNVVSPDALVWRDEFWS